jgi:CRISPR/Cas system-associated exonuclease Cas4 (RecB family)
MEIASTILSKYDAVFNNLPEKGRGHLRFGRSMVSISNITTQFYCEQKLDLASEYPMAPTEQMQKGVEAHEAAATLGMAVSKEEAVKDAMAEREEAIFICEFKIAWMHDGVPIIGMVDEAWFRGGNVDLVVERKFSNTLTVYNPYHVQAQLYCLGLGEMGFDISSAMYKIMIFKPDCRQCDKLPDRTCPIFALDGGKINCGKGEVVEHIYPMNKTRIRQDLDWALDFWLNKRHAIPTKNQAKCRACEYSGMCKSFLAR